MDFGGFGGAAAGGIGGLVRWHQDPHAPETAWQRATAIITSIACGSGFGYLTQAVVEWQCPTVPQSVAVGLAFVAGLASGVLSQTAVGLVSELTTRLKTRVMDRIAPDQPKKTDPADPK